MEELKSPKRREVSFKVTSTIHNLSRPRLNLVKRYVYDRSVRRPDFKQEDGTVEQGARMFSWSLPSRKNRARIASLIRKKEVAMRRSKDEMNLAVRVVESCMILMFTSSSR